MTSKKEIPVHCRWEVVWAEAKLERERETGSGGVTVANISELERVLLDRSLCVGRGEREEAWEEGSGQMPLLERKAPGWEWRREREAQ